MESCRRRKASKKRVWTLCSFIHIYSADGDLLCCVFVSLIMKADACRSNTTYSGRAVTAAAVNFNPLCPC